MVEEQSASFNSGSQDPYVILGLDPGASYESIKTAKEKKILEAGDDVIKKAKIEAAYDSLLMVSLKERQLGKVSNAAVNASEREESNRGLGSSLLTKLKGTNSSNSETYKKNIFTALTIPEGQGLTIRLAVGIFAFVLLLVSPDQSIEVILSLATIGLFVSQIKRGRKPLPSLGWSVVFLSLGLIIGGLLATETGLNPENISSLSLQQIEALPALVLIFLGTLILE